MKEFFSLFLKNKSYIKNKISFISPYTGYIYALLAGIILALQGIYYADTDTYFRKALSGSWKIPGEITHWNLLIPAKLSNISHVLTLILIPVILEILYGVAKKYKFVKLLFCLLLTLIILNGLSISLTYRDMLTINYLIEYPGEPLPGDSLQRLMANDNISLRAKAFLLDYSHININSFNDTEYLNFIDDLEKGKTDENLIKRLLFLKFTQDNTNHYSVMEKLNISADDENFSSGKLVKFGIEDDIFNLKHPLYYENDLLSSDAHVMAAIWYENAIYREYSYTESSEILKYLKKSIELYRQMKNDIYIKRIEEIEFRSKVAEKYGTELFKYRNDKIKTEEISVNMEFEIFNFLKSREEDYRAFRELQKIYSSGKEYLKLLGDKALELGEKYSPDKYYDDKEREKIFDFSRKCYEEAFKSSNNFDIYPSLGKVWFNLKEYKHAIDIYNIISAFRELTPEEHITIGQCYYEENMNRKEALSHYLSASKKLGEKFPPSLFYDMGVCFEDLGQYDKAIFYYKESLRKEEDSSRKQFLRRRIARLEKEKSLPVEEPEDDGSGSSIFGLQGLTKTENSAPDEKITLIEIREFHPDYIKITILMKNKPVDFLDYHGCGIYSLRHSEDMGVKITSSSENGKPVEKINISYLPLSLNGYSYISFKKKIFKGLNMTGNNGIYTDELFFRPEIDKFIYILAVPGRITMREEGNFTDYNRKYTVIPEEGWNIMIYDRSGCERPEPVYMEFAGIADRGEIDFTSAEWNFLEINKTPGIPIFKNLLFAFIPSFIPFLWLYNRKGKKVLPLILFPLITVLYYFTVITFNSSTLAYLAEKTDFQNEKISFAVFTSIIVVIYTLPYILTPACLYFISRVDRKIKNLKDILGFYPTDLVEEFFKLGGEEILQKNFYEHYDDLIIKGKTKVLKKYEFILVRCFNTPGISCEDMNEKLPAFFGKGGEKILIIVSLEGLSVKNKVDINNLKANLTVSFLIIEDIRSALFDEYSGKECDGSGIRNLIRNRIFMAEESEDLYYYTQKITDPLMFYGRKDVSSSLISLLLRGINVGIFGLRKIGKSSLDMYIQRELRKYPNIYPVIISLQRSTPSARGIFQDILEGLKTEMKGADPSIKIPPLMYDTKPDGTPVELAEIFKEDLINLKRIMPGNSKVIIFMDEIDLIFPEDNNRKNHLHFHTVFGTLRGLGEVDKFLVLAVQGFGSKINSINNFPEDFSLPENPVFQFFTEVSLRNLSKEDSDELIAGIGAIMGLSYGEESLGKIYLEAGGHPYLTRLLCSGIVNIIKERKVESLERIEPDVIEKAIDYCLKNHTDYFTYLDQLIGEEEAVLKTLLTDSSYREKHNRTLEKFKKLGIMKEGKEGSEISYNMYLRWIEGDHAS